VYYGPKLGHAVPWCTGFPFNLGVRHPQYLGSVLSVWAFLALLWGSGRPSLLPVCGAWTGLYAATAWVEDSL
jgi:methylene-fatty-acyl-phospholipid synthase